MRLGVIHRALGFTVLGLAIVVVVLFAPIAATPSPNSHSLTGYRIGYISNTRADGKWQLWVMESDGTRPHRVLWNLHGWNCCSASPNGRVLTYTRPERKGRRVPWEIWAMRPDGTGHVRLIAPLHWGGEVASLGVPAWSPDGRRFAFGARLQDTSREGVFVANADGTNIRRVLRPIYDYLGYPAVSATGQVAFGRDYAIRTVALDGGKSRPLVAEDYGDYEYSWSPDGRRLAYTAKFKGWPSLMVVDVYGRNRRLVLKGGSRLGEPTWAPKGDQIMFVDAREDGRTEIYVIRADGTGLHRLTHNTVTEGGIFWLRVGKG